jgi:signal peptidase II
MPLWLLAVAGIVLIFDQATKILVARRLALGQSVPVTSWLRIRRVASGRGVPRWRRPLVQLLVLAGLLGGICLIVRKGYFFQHRAAQLGLAMALGGAGSNVCDRLRRGTVMDFLDLGWWPVFNLADAAITMGVITALAFLR